MQCSVDRGQFLIDRVSYKSCECGDTSQISCHSIGKVVVHEFVVHVSAGVEGVLAILVLLRLDEPFAQVRRVGLVGIIVRFELKSQVPMGFAVEPDHFGRVALEGSGRG